MMRVRVLLCALGLLALSGCYTAPVRPTAPRPPQAQPSAPAPKSGPYEMDQDAPPLPGDIPPDVANTPDAVPREEPMSPYGNKDYSALGDSYGVLKTAKDFHERGYASWYGRKFQGHKTSSGEAYDMFKMTAAHKTLPLPTYVRVTRQDNGKSVIVRVNDRGPFHSTRIIDLSYAAAARLDMLAHGSTLVEIAAIMPEREGIRPAPVPPAPVPIPNAPKQQRGWLQVAVYTDPINAIAMREDLNNAGVTPVEIWSGGNDATPLNRVLVGPFPDVGASESARQKLLARGLTADWVNE